MTPVLPVFDVIVVGGGAAGMMAAIAVAESGQRVLLLEKNDRLGKKLAISGGGRCNITNAEFDTRALLDHYGVASNYLFSAFAQFGVQDTFSFFEQLNLPLKVQANKRTFPETEKASDVVKVLAECLKRAGVEIRTQCAVGTFKIEGGRIAGIETNQGKLMARRFILATGGMSHPETGSTGDGFRWLRQMGHTVDDPTPTIVPVKVKDAWIKALPGLALSAAKIAFYMDGSRRFAATGPILFTHFGLSGPTILNSAGKVADLLQEGTVTATIDVFPLLNHGQVEEHLLYVFDTNKNKRLSSVLRLAVPAGVDKAVKLLLPEVDFDGPVHSVSKNDRKKIMHVLKAMPCTISGLMGFDRAVVADGGVRLDEVDMRTLQSKLIANLYITGDLLHIKRPSGGYSLQLCWTTGVVAGRAAANS